MSKNTDVLIIGAGIVGLATAYQILQERPSTSIRIIEKETQPARHQTGRNSGVVHSGVYYKVGSSKARNCVEGREQLLRFCDEEGVSYQKLGKLIVATHTRELPMLEQIFARGVANGVAELEMIGPEKIQEIEPHVQAIRALHVPNCHVIHYPDVALRLCAKIQEKGVELVFGEKVHEILPTRNDVQVTTDQHHFQAKQVINCAGLFSDRIAKMTSPKEICSQQILPFRGEYYELVENKRDLVKGLIYPVPNPQFPFLGVHLTRMLDGKVEAGPNAVLACAREGYRKRDFSLQDTLEILRFPGFWKMAWQYWNIGFYEIYRSLSKRAFLRDLQRLVPSIEESDLIPGGSGVRAQVVMRNGKMLDDFSIVREDKILHVLNAPSPAATASFSIGKQISDLCCGEIG